ncbi:zinc finger CCCH domain-containing protein 14 [Thrips palmi]|uniref:Zinc finger CCCH domain-containing protein 14 n=1 Tax=Thrips palmi TaxID=161013 RepID=A0A6P8YX26_THRPL|nr:zinc finger CCCH domain-containing protein 14 [Thrips palmi]
MDGIRGEVSNKIRSAIKAKLMELGAYVDDELPDYIMVMVANKRSRQQMEDDLQLFLGDSTSTFTAWLHTVLNKLQQVTVNNTELKKGSEKKRPSIDDEKKDKRKKLKKEKDKEKPEKLGKAQEKSKIKNSAGEDKTEDTNRSQIQGKQIKSEPVDRAVPEASLQSKLSTHVNHQSASSITSTIQERNSSEARANEEEDDDDFINIKADVEADMWGETDETAAAAKNLNKSVAAPPPSRESKQQEPKEQELNRDQMNPAASEKLTSDSILPDAASVSACVSPSKNIESRPAPRIIKISETIRQEQETMKPSSKAVRDPQGLAKRVFQSHIVSLRNAQEKTDRDRTLGRSSSSHSNDNHSRRTDQRNRKREDLRETLRKERQRERERSRDRERERRRSGDGARKAQARGDSSSGRAFSSHRDENSPDPSLLSVVRVTPRPQMPAALQANRSLILKAVAEAQKSVSKPVVRPELADVKTRIKPLQLKRSLMDKGRIRKQLNVQTLSSLKKSQSNSKQSAHLPSRDALRKMSFTVLGQKAAPSQEFQGAEFGDISDESSIIIDPSLNILIQVPASPVEDAHEPPDPIQTEKVRRWIKDVEEATKSDTINLDTKTDLTTDAGVEVDNYGLESASKPVSDEDFEDTLEVDTNSLKTSDIHSVVISDDRSLRQPANTQFVVTLDGLDPRLLRSFAMEGDGCAVQMKEQIDAECHQDDRESLIREELVKEQLLREELLRQQAAIREQKANRNNASTVSSVVAPVKRPASPSCFLETRPAKVSTIQNKPATSERCKFWPSCKNGEKCEFHHPTVPCKSFPNCKFVDRCLYIHPNCRFNSMCTRADCSYTHTGPRPSLSTQTVGPNPLTSQPIKQACKYFPNCSNLSCPYIHPTVCKFGTHCTRPKCQFIHSDKGLMTKHKWVRQ